jgi:hypothetical protein
MTRKLSDGHRAPGYWRRRGHEISRTAASFLIAAIALSWAWQHVQTLIPDLPSMRFMDAVSVVVAAGLIVFALRLSWCGGNVRCGGVQNRSNQGE